MKDGYLILGYFLFGMTGALSGLAAFRNWPHYGYAALSVLGLSLCFFCMKKLWPDMF